MIVTTSTRRTSVCLALTAAVVLPHPVGARGAEAGPQPVVHDPLVDVGAPALSGTGRYVAHLAVRRDLSSPPQQVRRADLTAGSSELLNPSIDGGTARGNYSRPPVISSDGARTAFTSTAARLVAGDTNQRSDAFVRDAVSDTTQLVSVAFDGDAANGATGMASLSKSGRYAVFTSGATDVVPGSTTTNYDVYRRDLSTGTTVQVTVRRDGTPSRGPGSNTADVSADGSLVAFNSYNTDLVQADGADGESDLFVRDMTAGRTRWLSEGVPAGANPSGVVLSPDGAWVSSRWDDGSLHLTEVATGQTRTVARDAYAVLGSFSSQLSRMVYVAGGTPYVRNLVTGVTSPIPVPDGGDVTTVTISGNGRLAAFDWRPRDGSASRIFQIPLD